MSEARYEIVSAGTGWIVRHDADETISYATREAAFEAAIVAATRAVKEGYQVTILVPAPDSTAPGESVQSRE